MDVHTIRAVAEQIAAAVLILLALGFPVYRKIKKDGVKSLIMPAYILGVVLFGIVLVKRYDQPSYWLYSAIYSAQLFTLGVNPADMTDLIKEIPKVHQCLLMAVFWILFAGCPIITATFIAELAKDRFQKLKLRFTRDENICVFSEKNENSLAMAEKMLNSEKGEKWVVVFAETEPEKQRTPYYSIAIPVGKVFELIYRKNNVRLYFINTDEGANLDKFQQFKDGGYITEKYMKKALINVYTESDVIEEVLDNIKAELNPEKKDEKEKTVSVKTIPDMLVINPRVSFVQRLLWEHPLYAKQATPEALNVTVIGVGKFGGSFAANTIWCGQLPGTKLKLTLVDCDKEEKVLGRVFEKTTSRTVQRVPEVSFEYKFLCTDITADNFTDVVGQDILNSDYIMISMFDDDMNIKLAKDLRIFFGRNGKEPYILAYAKNDSKYNNLRGELEKKGIHLVGGLTNIYREGDVFTENLYSGAAIVYGSYSGETVTPRGFFAQEQKLIYSSYASAIHAKYKRFFLEQKKSEKESLENLLVHHRDELAECEHNRWMAFELIQGSVPASVELRKFVEENHRAGSEKPQKDDDLHIHGCIIPYSRLDELSDIVREVSGMEKNFKKNDITVTEKALEICKAIEAKTE